MKTKSMIAGFLALMMLLTLPAAALANGWTDPAGETIENVRGLSIPVPAGWISEESEEGVLFTPDSDAEMLIGVMSADIGMDLSTQSETMVSSMLELFATAMIGGMEMEPVGDKETLTIDGRKAIRFHAAGDDVHALIAAVPYGTAMYVIIAAAEGSVLEDMEPYFDSVVERASFGEAPAQRDPAAPAEPVPAAAPAQTFGGAIDPSALTGGELLALRDAIAAEQQKRDEWQSVEVPKGVYTIGEDIPAAHWTVSALEGATAYVYWCDVLDASGAGMSWDGNVHENAYLRSRSYKYAEPGDPDHVSWNMENGQYFIVDDGIAVFTPFAGKDLAEFEGLDTPANLAFDLSGYDWQGLIDLRARCGLAMWGACEGKASLTAGVYVIGTDIPAGKYTIAPREGGTCFIYWGDALDATGQGLSFEGDIFNSEYLKSETFAYYTAGDATKVTWDMKDGQFFIVDDGVAVFGAPEAAKLGFK